MSATLIAAAEQLIRQQSAGEGSGHDWWHIHRVRVLALRIARSEGADLVLVELAALLHDIADWKFHGGDLSAGPRAARDWMTIQQADPALIDAVCEIIAGISYKGASQTTPMRTLEGCCVQDADRLDAVGAMGIARAFAYGGHANRLIYDPDHPPEQHESPAAYRNSQGPTINHFYEKLLLLKDRMLTPTGRQLAEARHAFLETYLEQFFAEWNGQR